MVNDKVDASEMVGHLDDVVHIHALSCVHADETSQKMRQNRMDNFPDAYRPENGKQESSRNNPYKLFVMDYLEHKGYKGTIEYSKEDDCLFGKVVGIGNDLITYQGNTIQELKEDFQTGIDSCINMCITDGNKPKNTKEESC